MNRSAKYRLFLVLTLVIVLSVTMVSSVDAGTTGSTPISGTTDYVDNNTSDVDSHIDHGTHSVFADLQDYGANYDAMTEADTGIAGFNLEDYVDQISDLHTPSPDVGTHSSFAEMQNSDAVYDTLTEANTGGAGVNELKYVDTAPTAVWTQTGTAPYLDAYDTTNYISTVGNGGVSGWYDFAATSGAGTGFTVNMSTWASDTDADETLAWELDWTSDGVADATGSWTPSSAGQWYAAGTITGLDTQTEIDACRIRYTPTKGGGSPGTMLVDAAYLGISQSGGAVYDLDLEVGWTAADFDETNEELCIYGGTQGAEALRVDVWNGAWTNVITDVVAGWNNVSVSSYLTGTAFEIRFTDTTDDAVLADAWEVEGVLLHVWSAGSSNYELDLEIGWTAADFDETVEQLCIYPVTGGGWPAENILVDIWTGSWTNLFADLTPDTWNNISISSYLTGVAVEVRFLGGTETGDTTQSTWEIDVVLIQTYSYAYIRNDQDVISIVDGTISTARSRSKGMTETIGVADVDTNSVDFARALTETISVVDSIVKSIDWARLFTETVAIADTMIRSVNYALGLLETIGIAILMTRAKIANLGLTETIGIADTITRSVDWSRIFIESLSVTEVMTRSVDWARVLTESIGVAIVATHAKFISKHLSESIGVVDTMTRSIDWSRTLTETIGVAIVATNSVDWARTLTESISVGIVATHTKDAGGTNYQKSLNETIGMADSITRSIDWSRVLTETVGVVIVDTNSVDWARSYIETIGIVDAIGNKIGKGFVETIGIVDIMTRSVDWSRVLTESIGIVVVGTNSVDWARAFTESIGVAIVDTNTKDSGGTDYVKNLTETIGLAGLMTRSIDWSRVLTETINAVIVDTNSVDYVREYVESIGMADSKTIIRGRLQELTESIAASDSIARAIDYSRELVENISATIITTNTGGTVVTPTAEPGIPTTNVPPPGGGGGIIILPVDESSFRVLVGIGIIGSIIVSIIAADHYGYDVLEPVELMFMSRSERLKKQTERKIKKGVRRFKSARKGIKPKDMSRKAKERLTKETRRLSPFESRGKAKDLHKERPRETGKRKSKMDSPLNRGLQKEGRAPPHPKKRPKRGRRA